MVPNEEKILTSKAGHLLLVLSVGWASYRVGMMALSPLLPSLIEEFQITPFLAGLTLTIIWVFNAMGQFPSGRLSDELSRKTLLVAGLSSLGSGFFLVFVARSYAEFLVGAVFVGIGAGVFPTPARALITDLFTESRGRAYGIHTASGDLGGALAAGIAVLALGLGSWRYAFVPVVVVIPLVLLFFHFISEESFGIRRVKLGLTGTGRRLVGDRSMRLLLVAFSLYGLTWMGSTSFLPTYLQVEKSFSPALAGAAFAALFVVGTVAKPMAGYLGDEYGHVPVAVGSFLVCSVGLGVVVLGSTVAIIGVGVVAFASGLLAIPPLLLAILMDIFPSESRGGDLGATRTVWIGVGSLGPTYVGFVSQHLTYASAFVGLIGFMLLSGAFVVLATSDRQSTTPS